MEINEGHVVSFNTKYNMNQYIHMYIIYRSVNYRLCYG